MGEAIELLESRGDLAPGELESHVEEWARAASSAEEHERFLTAGEMLLRLSNPGGRLGHREDSNSCPRAMKAAELLTMAARAAEATTDTEAHARALSAKAHCQVPGSAEAGKKGVALLEETYGKSHPETTEARKRFVDKAGS